MARTATGELRELADGWEARIRIQGKERKGFFLPHCPAEAEARERCTAMAQIAVRLRRAGEPPAEVVELLTRLAKTRPGRPWDAALAGLEVLYAGKADKGGPQVPTFKDFAESWIKGDLHRAHPDHVREKKPSSIERDKGLFANYVKDVIGDYPVNAITLDLCEQVMAGVPVERSPMSRRQVAQFVTKVLAYAVYPARHMAASPVPRGWLPKLGKAKAMQYVRPDEDTTHLAGERVDGTGRVPFLRRLFLGISRREGFRKEELSSLRFRDLDLERGAVRLDENKTNEPRAWALDPGVAEALRRWKQLRGEVQPEDHVFEDTNGVRLNVARLSEEQRDDLTAVGVDRPELYAEGPTRRKLRAHDTRASFITCALANGRTESWVADRTGHTTSAMINRYRRAARTWGELDLGVWASLHLALPELASIAPRLPQKKVRPLGGMAYAANLKGEPTAETSRNIEKTSTNGDPTEPGSARHGAPQGQSRGVAGPVEEALATALEGATAAGRWDVVAQLAKELEARRLAVAGVVDLNARRRLR